MIKFEPKIRAIPPGATLARSAPPASSSAQSPSARIASMAIHGKYRPGKPNRYLRILAGRGGHISKGGTLTGVSGVHPATSGFDELFGEFMPQSLRSATTSPDRR